MRIAGASLLGLVVAIVWAAPPADSVQVAILGDRTGETQPGVYQRIWEKAAAEKTVDCG